jgi:hypothetical protein
MAVSIEATEGEGGAGSVVAEEVGEVVRAGAATGVAALSHAPKSVTIPTQPSIEMSLFMALRSFVTTVSSATVLDQAFYAARSYSLMRATEDGLALDPRLEEVRGRMVGAGRVKLPAAGGAAARCNAPGTGPAPRVDAVRRKSASGR